MMTSLFEEKILALEEPIMIVGNRIPDGDSVGSMAAILDYVRSLGIEAYMHFVVPPADNLSWMVDPEDLNLSIIHDYESLIVVDDKVDSDRLGFEIKPGIPTINIDHHKSNFTEDLNYTTLVASESENIFYFQKDSCATAAVLFELGVAHPFMLCSLYTDSVGFTVNSREAILTAADLIRKCDISNKDIEQYFYRLSPRGLPVDALAYPEMSICHLYSKEVSGLIVISPDIGSSSFKIMLESFRKFSDFVVFINKDTGQTSFRSDLDEFPVLPYALHFGGGGHARACGCTLSLENFFSVDQLVSLICRDLDSPSIQWVN